MNLEKVKMEASWKKVLGPEFEKDYMGDLRSFLKTQYADHKSVFPKGEDYFSAFNLTPFDKVKVVILGQDPYHGPNQAHGLSFSVRPGVRLPPSLMNIYKELQQDLGITPPTHGYLTHWAEQGVLLLNSVLTVEKGRAGSHQNRGWEEFTDQAIKALNEGREHIAFVLWGAYAQRKGEFIDRSRHFVIESPHPSPFSARRGFFGSKPFSRINAYLRETGQTEIDWNLPENPKLH